MECVRGTASLPLNGETTEEVYLAPGTGKPGVQLDSPILPPNCFLLKIDFSSFSCHLRPSPWKLFLLIEINFNHFDFHSCWRLECLEFLGGV